MLNSETNAFVTKFDLTIDFDHIINYDFLILFYSGIPYNK